MTIILGNAWSEVKYASASTAQSLRKFLSYPVPNRKWALRHHLKRDHDARAYRHTFEELSQYAKSRFPNCPKCQWNWEVSLAKGRFFPTGLAPLVQKAFDIEIEDQRQQPTGKPVPHSVKLRDYQHRIVEAAKTKGSGIIEVATGGGKTEIAIALANELGVKTLIVVPTTTIFNEFHSRWPKYCREPLGRIAQGKIDIQRVTVAIFDDSWAQSELGKRLAAETECLIVDEHHKAAAQTWYEYLLSVNAYYRFGLTATPFRESQLESMRLYALAGPKIDVVNTQTLQKNGYLTPAIVRMITCPVYSNSRKEWSEYYREAIVYNALRNGHIITNSLEAAARGERVLIIVSWDEHGELLQQAIGKEKVVYFVGSTGAKKLAQLKQKFINETPIAIGTPVVDLGFDVPVIDTLIMAAGGKAEGRTQQRLGRALRKAPDKELATIIDFLDKDGGLLERHSRSRIATYKRLGQFVMVDNEKLC